jgi:hypothetical protein
MTENQLKETERKTKKRSMTSCLSIEAANMCTLLSVKDWSDKKSKMNLFTEKLIKDKDAKGEALNLIASCTTEWKGVVSKKGLAQFFTTGYAALDVSIHSQAASQFSCSSSALQESRPRPPSPSKEYDPSLPTPKSMKMQCNTLLGTNTTWPTPSKAWRSS